ncbi:MAG: hypothetical protein WCU88_07125 [Elusimicrobiota bacterium]|jgi:hypothetical protein
MLSFLLETAKHYSAQWVALDRRLQVIDHCAELGPLQERLRARARACTFLYVPKPSEEFHMRSELCGGTHFTTAERRSV